jgi:aquaporin Z
MNPARTLGPDLVSVDFLSFWVYVLGPMTGAVLAVGIAYILRGPGGGMSSSVAAQGVLVAEEARIKQEARDKKA